MKKLLFLKTLLASLLFCLLFLSGCENWDESGVKLYNEMPSYALEYIDKNKILDPKEKVLAYYDVTLSLDSGEATILTNKRVIYHKNNKNQSIKYTDIDDIEHRDEGFIIGDIILVKSVKGEIMKIEIAPLNDGKVFLDVLRAQLEPEKQEQVEAEPEPEQEPPAPVPSSISLDQLKKTNRCPDCNLEKANLQGWKLKGADLNGADLSGADLSGADLSRANLSGANLMWANLKGANLENADIGGTDFRGAELSGATSPKGTRCTQDAGSACLE